MNKQIVYLGCDGPMNRRTHANGVTLLFWSDGNDSGADAYAGVLNQDQIDSIVHGWTKPATYRGCDYRPCIDNNGHYIQQPTRAKDGATGERPC